MVKKIVKKKKTIKKDYEVGYKKPPMAHAFKPGNNMNPKGGNIPKELRVLKQLSEKTIQDIIEFIMINPTKDLKTLLLNEELPHAQRILIKAALKAEKDDSFHQLNEMLNRAIGAVKQKLDHSSSDGSMSPNKDKELENLSLDDLKTLKEIRIRMVETKTE